MISDPRVIKKLEAMDEQEWTRFMASGTITVATADKVVNKRIVRMYAPKIRGVVVSKNGKWRYETPGLARAAATEIRAEWRREVAEMDGDK
jgi:hypothetical protein